MAAVPCYLRLSPDGPTLGPQPGAPSLRLDATLALDERPRVPDRVEVPSALEAVHVFEGLGEARDRIVDARLGGRLVVVERTWRLAGRGRVRLSFGVETDVVAGHWTVPAVLYDGNRVGEGRFPTGGPEVGWSFREDRCALPSASFVADAGRCVGVWTEPAPTEDRLSAVQTRAVPGGVLLAIHEPLLEAPVTYRRKFRGLRAASPATRRTLPLEPGVARTRRFLVYLGPGGPHGWHDAFRATWTDQPLPPPVDDWAEVVRAKAGRVANQLYFRRGDEAGFVTVTARGCVPVINTLSAGFLGKNLELALSLYRIGAATGTRALCDRGADVADFFGRGRLRNGLFYTDYQLARRRWYGLSFPRREEVSTRMMGEAGIALLRLALLAGEGRGRPWMDQARALGDFFVGRLPYDGNPGKWWTYDGRRDDETGTNGAYVVAFLAALHRATRDGRYLGVTARGADYFADLAMRGELSGDTLDALCIDKEAGHAVLRALLAAWRETGVREHLLGAVAAARFVDTWIWTWDVPFAPSTPLGRRGFRTTGGTSVSVAHHHLDPYGVAIALDYLRLATATGDDHWRRVARHLIAWCRQLVVLPADRLGRPARMIGWQPEQVQHTDWAYWSRRATPRGSYYSDIAWVPALTLGALLDLREEFPAEVSFDLVAPELRQPALWRRAVRRILARVNFVA